MSNKDLLSQEEVDALLTGLESGELDTGGLAVGTDVIPYDLENSDNPLSGTPRAFSKVYENFVVSFRKQLSDLLQHPVDVVSEGTHRIEFSAYLEDMGSPQSFNIVTASALQGQALIVLNAELVTLMVDIFFGGDGTHAVPVVDRDFTRAEKRIVKLVLDRAFNCLAQAWSPVLQTTFSLERSEKTSEFVDIARPKEVVFATRLRIRLKGSDGYFDVTLPYSMLDLVKQELRECRPNTETAGKDWPKTLGLAVQEMEVELIGNLTETELTLGEIINLKQGDVITVTIPEQVRLKAERLPLFLGVYGQNKGQNSVRVTHKLTGSNAPQIVHDPNAEEHLQ
jgi:flagellar motor switch protein FliM